jgi:hypothetical protein
LFSQKQMHFLLNLEKRKQVKLPAENWIAALLLAER